MANTATTTPTSGTNQPATLAPQAFTRPPELRPLEPEYEAKLQHQYTLAKQIPDLAERGCTIATSYGDFTIPTGKLAKKLAQFLTRELSKKGGQQ